MFLGMDLDICYERKPYLMDNHCSQHILGGNLHTGYQSTGANRYKNQRHSVHDKLHLHHMVMGCMV